MPTIKAVTRPKKDKDRLVPIYIKISDGGQTCYVSTGKKIKPALWNKRKGKIRENDDFKASALNKIIGDKIKEIMDDEYRLGADSQPVNANILKKELKILA